MTVYGLGEPNLVPIAIMCPVLLMKPGKILGQFRLQLDIRRGQSSPIHNRSYGRAHFYYY
jgi:hypothetical protein